MAKLRDLHFVPLMDSYLGLGVRYIKWGTLYGTGRLDDRVRPSHEYVNGEIAELGHRFSNGLLFPGDFSGQSPEETINCRCTPVPYFLPKGYTPPGPLFREEDLLKLKRGTTDV